MQRFIARLVLAAALLAAWQSALVHPIVHVDEHGGFVHLDGHEHESQSDPSDLCDALAAVAACVADGFKQVFAASSSERVAYGPSSTRLAAEPPPFLSQGPPQLL